MDEIMDVYEISEEDYKADLKKPWSKNDDFKFEYFESITNNRIWSREEEDELFAEIRAEGEYLSKLKRNALAQKVLRGDNLDSTEREEIYYVLTGNRPAEKKKGSPTKDVRNAVMALEYLCRIYKGNKPNIVKNKIKKKYSINEENTFYVALKKGKKILEAIANEQIEEYYFDEDGIDQDDIGQDDFCSESKKVVQIDRMVKSSLCSMYGSDGILTFLRCSEGNSVSGQTDNPD